jgi:hypothetical protein
MKLGIIARSDNTGLGNQTRELVNLLNPYKILLIDSSHFNQNQQHPEWYDEPLVTTTEFGFATDQEVESFVSGLDAVLSCETFYNNKFVQIAKRHGVKTYLQYNYEFLDYLQKPQMPLPDVLIAPSTWNLDEIKNRFGGKSEVVHLPPPTNSNRFKNAKEINLSQNHDRVLHIAGKAAAEDRNGTQTVIDMMKHSKGDFLLDIRTQTEIKLPIRDSRINLIYDNVERHEDLYSGYDAMILPRRYAGLCLPMNEALLSALPVFMTDISPNNDVLPQKWLASSKKIGELMTRTKLNVYSADPIILAKLLDSHMGLPDRLPEKLSALTIGTSRFCSSTLAAKYKELF